MISSAPEAVSLFEQALTARAGQMLREGVDDPVAALHVELQQASVEGVRDGALGSGSLFGVPVPEVGHQGPQQGSFSGTCISF